MSTHQPNLYWITSDEREHQRLALLEQEIEIQRDASPFSALSTDHRSDLDEHRDTTNVSLVEQEHETLADQLPTGSTVADNMALRTSRDDALATAPLHREKTSRMIAGWPSSPKPIATPIYVKVLNGFFDVLLSACSIAFLAFAIAVNIHDQDPVAGYPRLTTTLLSATKYGPTVFPILFASIIGHAAHAILLWRLERGGRIGILDTLAGSTSLTSTVISQLQLRTVSILGVALLSLWSLSPIGGQVSVRIMTIGPKDTKINDSLWYMINSGYLGAYSSAETEIQSGSMAGVVFVAALMGSPGTKSSPLDIWDNVKVPRIEGYENAVSMDHDGWYEIKDSDSDAYSSLVGIPILDMNQSNFIDFAMHIQSPYFSLRCSMNTTVSESDPIDDEVLPGSASNATSFSSILYWNIPNLDNVSRDSWRDRVLPEEASPLRIKYVPTYRSNFTLTCDITQSYVETEVRCPTPSTCAASRIRRSRLDHYPAAWTLLDISWRPPKLLFQGMLKPFTNGKVNLPQLFDRYLADPDLINSNFAEVSQTTEDKYTIRLGQMLNTYFSCLNGFFAITAGINNDTAFFWDNKHTFKLPPNVNGSWQDLYDSTGLSNPLKKIFQTRAWTSEITKVKREDVIVAHSVWVIALCIASIVLIVASLVAPVVRHFFATGVDVAMNISSLATRNNPHMSLPQTGTYLDASDRARLLYNYQVRLGDADSMADVGSLVIGSLDRDEVQDVARVRKRRLYE